jgi:hypothetical protein
MEALVALLDRPDALPAAVTDREAGLKYDLYMARGRARPGGWGITVNDRHEPEVFGARLDAFIGTLPGRYRRAAVEIARDRLRPAAAVLTFAAGFDRPGASPRLKFYFQEDEWGRGVCEAGQAFALARELAPDVVVPGWLDPGRRVGVVAVELEADGGARLKLYLGGTRPAEAAAGAPRRDRLLARALGEVSPMPGGYHYLTVRLREDGPARCAINKIYNAVRLAGPGGAGDRAAAWDDVRRLFAFIGDEGALARLMETVPSDDSLVVVPTASALEGRADSADVYFTVWERSGEPGEAAATLQRTMT